MWGALARGVLVLLAAVVAAGAQPAKPALPPGRDPGGIAIALLSTGIDYTLPEVAARLARDGEGELIGWDALDGDNRPLAARGATPANWGGNGTLLARAVGPRGRRLIPVRASPAEPASLATAVAFVAQTPARMVAVPMWSHSQPEWQPFRLAAARASGLLFLVPAGEGGKDLDRDPVWPAGFGLSNVLVVSLPRAAGAAADRTANHGRGVDLLVSAPEGAEAAALGTALAVVRAADVLAGCWPELVATLSGSGLKQALLSAAGKGGPAAERPLLAPCVGGTGKR